MCARSKRARCSEKKWKKTTRNLDSRQNEIYFYSRSDLILTLRNTGEREKKYQNEIKCLLEKSTQVATLSPVAVFESNIRDNVERAADSSDTRCA